MPSTSRGERGGGTADAQGASARPSHARVRPRPNSRLGSKVASHEPGGDAPGADSDPSAPPSPPGSPTAVEHGRCVTEVRTRIESLISGALGVSPEEAAARARRASKNGAPPEVGSDSDDEVYQHFPALDAAEIARSRVERLVARLQTERRQGALSEVDSWLQDRKVAAKGEIESLRRMEDDCGSRGVEFEGAAEEMVDALKSHERGTTFALKEFYNNLRHVSSKRKGMQSASKHGRGRDILTSKDALEAAIQEARCEVKAREEEAWQVLRELAGERKAQYLTAASDGMPATHSHHSQASARSQPHDAPSCDDVVGSTPSGIDCGGASAAEQDMVGCGTAMSSVGKRLSKRYPPKEIVDEQRRALALLKEQIRQTEQRSHILKTVFEYLNRGVGLEDISAVRDLDAAGLLKELREEAMESLLPQLREERERLHGHELVAQDECRLNKLQQDCDFLSQKVEDVSEVLEDFERPGKFEEDTAQQIRSADAGGLIGDFLLLRSLAAADHAEEWHDDLDLDADEDERMMHERRRVLRKQEAEIRHAADRLSQENLKLLEEMREHTAEAQRLRIEAEAEEQANGVVEASIGLVEDHRALFESATHWVTKRRRDEEVRKKQGELVSSGGRGSMLYRPLDDIQWADEFFSEEGLQEQSLNTLLGEQEKLARQCAGTDSSMENRLRHWSASGYAAGVEGPGARAVEQLQDCARSSRAATEDLERTLRALEGLGVMTNAFDEARVCYTDRAAAVRIAREQLREEVPEADIAQVADIHVVRALHLQDAVQAIVATLQSMSGEIGKMRTQMNREKDNIKNLIRMDKKGSAKKVEARDKATDSVRRSRQKHREMLALRTEIKALQRERVANLISRRLSAPIVPVAEEPSQGAAPAANTAAVEASAAEWPPDVDGLPCPVVIEEDLCGASVSADLSGGASGADLNGGASAADLDGGTSGASPC